MKFFGCLSCVFFFSSRRRHTRFKCDWSPDVCSSDWLREMPAQRLFNPPQTTTLATVLYGVLGPVGTWLALGTIGVGVLAVLRFDLRGEAALAGWLALSGVAAPYTWSYDHILLLVPLVVGAGVVARRSRRAAVLLIVAGTLTFLVLTTLLAVVAAARNLESFSAVVPLAIFAMIVGSLWPQRRASADSLAAVYGRPNASTISG